MRDKTGTRFGRRQFLVGAAALLGASTRAWAQPAPTIPLPDQDLIELLFDAGPARRATVLVPQKIPNGTKLPVLVLLHGLGETTSERLGAYAWVERYGLGTNYSRLLHPPVQVGTPPRYLRPERAQEINAQLGQRPFTGMILVCPFTPNVYNTPSFTRALDVYGTWLADKLLPMVRQRTPALTEARYTGIDGCSLGGFMSLEIFLRHPELFGTVGGVQTAIAKASVPAYTQRLAEAVAKQPGVRIHLQTSISDRYHDAHQALQRQLQARGLKSELRVAPGPHNQPWLREVGTLEMLLWHDEKLRSARG